MFGSARAMLVMLDSCNAQNAAMQFNAIGTSLSDLSGLLNAAHGPPREETIVEWCARLQRAVERCGDGPMDYEEYSRWRDEMDAWREKQSDAAT